MDTLCIDLQDGFAGDSIILRVGEREVFRGDGMRTSRLLGYALCLAADVPRGRAVVTVEVPSRGLLGETTVEVDGDAYLGVSISADGVAFQRSGSPFSYA